MHHDFEFYKHIYPYIDGIFHPIEGLDLYFLTKSQNIDSQLNYYPGSRDLFLLFSLRRGEEK
jgi:hypothetical protein